MPSSAFDCDAHQIFFKQRRVPPPRLGLQENLPQLLQCEHCLGKSLQYNFLYALFHSYPPMGDVTLYISNIYLSMHPLLCGHLLLGWHPVLGAATSHSWRVHTKTRVHTPLWLSQRHPLHLHSSHSSRLHISFNIIFTISNFSTTGLHNWQLCNRLCRSHGPVSASSSQLCNSLLHSH